MCRIVLWVVSVLPALPAPSPPPPPRYDMNLLPEVILPRTDLSLFVFVYVYVFVYISVFVFNIKSASVLFLCVYLRYTFGY